jgi:hypothetical protein
MRPLPPRIRSAVSVAALIGANAIPLIGVLFWGWKVFPLIFLYWLENVVVGGFNVLRMLTADPDQPIEWVAKLFFIPFFCVHFGMFTFVHGSLVLSLFGKDAVPALAHSGWPTPSLVLATIHQTGTGAAFVALLISHGVSFLLNYIGGGEYRNVSLQQLMAQPYSRIIILHFVVLFGAFLAAALHSALPALVLLVALKVGADLKAHQRERVRLGAPGSAAPASAP